MRFILLFLLFFNQNLHSQKQFEKDNELTITGIVIAENNKPLEYATVTIKDSESSDIITGGLTDKNGQFLISAARGVYNINIDFISFSDYNIEKLLIDKDTDLGKIIMKPGFESLDEVEIIAEETTVEIKLDKKIYTVGKDLTARGGTALDVLDNIPSVSTDIDGNILLRGNDAARVLINGKPSNLVGVNSSFIRQLPTDAIEKVEVITSPSARFEAQGTGGIINLILRKSKKLGFNGSLSLNYAEPKSNGVSANSNYRSGKLNFFNSLGINDRNRPGESGGFTEYFNGDEPSTFFLEDRDRNRNNKGYLINNGVEWFIDENTSILGSFFYNDYESLDIESNLITEIDENFSPINSITQVETEGETEFNREYNLNFEKKFNESGKKLTIDFQYNNSNEWEDGIINENGVENEIITSDEDNKSYLIQSDYVNPIGENKQFEIGFRVNNDEKLTDYRVFELVDNNFEEDLGQSNLFQYKEKISAFYSQYGLKLDDTYSFLFGLRIENTVKNINQITTNDFTKIDETGIFPTFNFGYEFKEDETLTFGYNRRINRPWSRFINPFPTKISPILIWRGNPYLYPTYSNNLDLGYIKKFPSGITVNTSTYFQKSTNIVNTILRETGNFANIEGVNVPINERFPINLSSSERFGFELNISYNQGRFWNIISNLNIFENEIIGSYEGTVYDSKNVSWDFKINNKLSLPAKIQWQTSVNIRGPRKTAVNKREGDISIDMGLSKDLFKENATISLNVKDLLDQRGWKNETFNDNFYNDYEFRWGVRRIVLNFIYRFNQKKNQRNPQGFNNQGEF